jgi:cytochrome c biogenesis protein CcdA
MKNLFYLIINGFCFIVYSICVIGLCIKLKTSVLEKRSIIHIAAILTIFFGKFIILIELVKSIIWTVNILYASYLDEIIWLQLVDNILQVIILIFLFLFVFDMYAIILFNIIRISVYIVSSSNTYQENLKRQKSLKCQKYTFIIGYITVFSIIGIVFYPKNLSN